MNLFSEDVEEWERYCDGFGDWLFECERDDRLIEQLNKEFNQTTLE